MYREFFYQEGVQCHLEDLTFHSVLRNAPSTISALHIRGVNLSKIHAWTLALIAKFACLEEISLCGCILPIGNESMLSRLIAPSFHSLASISVTDSNQVRELVIFFFEMKIHLKLCGFDCFQYLAVECIFKLLDHSSGIIKDLIF